MERQIVLVLAGSAAEKKIDPLGMDRFGDGDLAAAYGYANHMLSGESPANTPYIGTVETYLDWMQARATALMARPMTWDAVVVLARALLDQGRLSERALRQIIGETVRLR